MLARRRVALAMLGLAVLLAGCSSGAQRVNLAARQASMSTQRDKDLAGQTMVRLSEGTADYRIGAGDIIEIAVFQWELPDETKTVEAEVSQQGIVPLPLIGNVKVKGKTVEDVKAAIEKALIDGDYIKTPRVTVAVKEFLSKRVAVVGAVNEPGSFTLRRNVTQLLDVLSLAGGLKESAGQHLYVVRTRGGDERRKRQKITIDLHELLVMGNLKLNVVLSDGDVVNVPIAEKFYVSGYVKTPGAFDLKRPTNVLMAVAMAGGLERPGASPGSCTLKRGEKEISIDLVAIADGKTRNVYLKPGDTLDVGQTFLRGVGLGLWEAVKSLFHIGYSVGG